MIQITYNEMGDMMFLRAEGHAEFAPKGQDIVCAAVSALMQTLAYSLDSGTVTCADDRNLMVVQAKQGTDSLAKFELVTDGLILLADAYPEHVRYINLHADKADAIDLQLFADGGTGANGDGWTYTYSATKIRGLKQTHQPSPWINDYGSFSIMPVTTGPVYDEEGRQSWFSHKAETVKPYSYQVYLDVFSNGRAEISVIPANRDAIRYTGGMDMQGVFFTSPVAAAQWKARR